MPTTSFFILGLVVASVIAEEQSVKDLNSTTIHPNTVTSNSSIIPNTSNLGDTDALDINDNSSSNMDVISNTTAPSATEAAEPSNGDTVTEAKTTKKVPPTPSPAGFSTIARATNKEKNHKTTAKPQPNKGSSASTGIIIVVVLIIVIFGFLIACYLARKRGRRYSVDLTSRPDGANVPLSTVEPEVTADTAPQNGLQTFQSTETTAKEPEEPEAQPEAKPDSKPEAQEEQKAEADKAVADPSAEAAAPAPDSSEDKPKADVVEQSPPAPVESTVEEKTDDKATVSSKTSVESLNETNENNSNNTDFSQTRNLIFWEVPLDYPV